MADKELSKDKLTNHYRAITLTANEKKELKNDSFFQTLAKSLVPLTYDQIITLRYNEDDTIVSMPMETFNDILNRLKEAESNEKEI